VEGRLLELPELSGDCSSSFGLPRGDRVDSITDISRRELGGMTPRSLGKVRPVLSPNRGDGTHASTSGEVNLVVGKALVKASKDVVESGRGE
jgi:hypothetical protein